MRSNVVVTSSLYLKLFSMKMTIYSKHYGTAKIVKH